MQPITDANIAAHEAALIAAIRAGEKILVAEGSDRVRSARIMGEWIRARPGTTEADLKLAFTRAELARFLPDALDYAKRHSADLH